MRVDIVRNRKAITIDWDGGSGSFVIKRKFLRRGMTIEKAYSKAKRVMHRIRHASYMDRLEKSKVSSRYGSGKSYEAKLTSSDTEKGVIDIITYKIVRPSKADALNKANEQ